MRTVIWSDRRWGGSRDGAGSQGLEVRVRRESEGLKKKNKKRKRKKRCFMFVVVGVENDV